MAGVSPTARRPKKWVKLMKWKLKRSRPSKKQMAEADRWTQEQIDTLEGFQETFLVSNIAIQLYQDFIAAKGLDAEFEVFLATQVAEKAGG